LIQKGYLAEFCKLAENCKVSKNLETLVAQRQQRMTTIRERGEVKTKSPRRDLNARPKVYEAFAAAEAKNLSL
jgi:hypothetical protein